VREGEVPALPEVLPELEEPMKILPALLLLLAACCTPEPCITPPPMSSAHDNEVAIGISAQLSGIPVGGSLSTSFKNIVNTQYDQLDENDKALFLFLRAIDCYLKDGKAGEDVAQVMAQLVKDKYSAKAAAAPVGARILPLSRTHLGPQINALLTKFKVTPLP
jgi:hypothetical protein